MSLSDYSMRILLPVLIASMTSACTMKNITVGHAVPRESAKGLKSDFILPVQGWQQLISDKVRGRHEIFNVREGKEKIFLYRTGPGAEIAVQEHDLWEECVIIEGSLEWLDSSGNIQQVLRTGFGVKKAATCWKTWSI